MEIIYLIIAVILGFLLGYLLKSSANKEQVKLAEQNQWLQNSLSELKATLEKRELLISHQTSQLATLSEREKAQQELLNTQKQQLEQLHKQLTEQFENLANRILNNSRVQLSQENQEKLGLLLDPLKERIASFEKKVESAHQDNSLKTALLREELQKLAAANLQISEDAKNLTSALKGDQKTQGNWGEMVLERILENSGLHENSEYITQGQDMSLYSAEGKHQKPDVIILLPDEKHLIIDAKVSLKAYEGFVNSDADTEKQKLLNLHVKSIKDHVKGLSEKYYQSQGKLNTPDFVLLFLPMEAAFSVAVQSGMDDLFNYAWERKVVIVSPTTLLATLRTVASIWKNEKQQRNALQIADEGAKLYDKLVGFVEDVERIGKGLQQSQKSYDDAVNKLKTGRGNLIDRAEKLKELGVNPKKSLDSAKFE